MHLPEPDLGWDCNLSIFGHFFFFLNLSFKIAMSRRAGVWRVSDVVRDFSDVTFFFSGLLSYLVGVKRRTSRCVTCKRDNSC